jgi:hypothetical protein
MELDELDRRRGPFVRAKYADPAAVVLAHAAELLG